MFVCFGFEMLAWTVCVALGWLTVPVCDNDYNYCHDVYWGWVSFLFLLIILNI